MIRRLSLPILILALATSSYGKGPKKPAAPKEADPPADTTPPPTSQPSDNSALIKAQSDLQAARAAAKTKYESDPAWTTALANLKSAEADSDAAVKPVLAAEKNDASYKSAADELAKAEDKMTELRQSDEPNASEMSAAASSAMTARAKMRSLEKSAVAADPSASAAQQKLIDAQAAMTKLREDEQKTIDADAAVIAAKEEVDSAKTAHS
jgi:hypothetical protein